MKVLFSPSEAKVHECVNKSINQDTFLFSELYLQRLEVINKFSSYIYNANMSELQDIFGTKDAQECLRLKNIDLLNSCTIAAIQRYSGVAYEHLDFASLSNDEKDFLLGNVIIFSNLFGPILAKDQIPYYKLKQGAKIRNFKIEHYYKQNFSKDLDAFLKDEFIIDLRAGFYEKFYTLKQEHICIKFLKNGKVLSHYAKAYRGLLLRKIAKYQPQSLEAFQKMDFKGLHVKEILAHKHNLEFVFEIDAI
ncbi:MAG: YaaA family protein [Sulfurospirillum sp.]|nr:YaaA family protein [Sulfurospirillum sp.]